MLATKPHCVGYWAVQITPQLDLIKFGLEGDNKHPFKTAAQAIAEVNHLKRQDPKSRYFMLRLFDNGQMKTFDFDD